MKLSVLRLLFYSRDIALRPVLAPALGSEFLVAVESDEDRIRAVVHRRECDVLILDLSATDEPTPDRLAFCTEMLGTSVAVLVMTDDDRRAVGNDLIQEGAFACFRKPPALREVRVLACRAYEFAQSKRRPVPAGPIPVNPCGNLVGTCAPMRRVYELIRRVGPLNTPVLITGESGTGKELVARAIHNYNARPNRPFVAVSCGAIPENLIEAELFGHEKGAFTGTVGAREGYFEQAKGGTLFLDEIGELNHPTQVKLLRVLAQREFNRLGSGRLIPLEARVVFATHRDLAQMVEAGSFRRDLYYRVNVMSIECPPLRDRAGDIPMLTLHMIRQFADQYGSIVRHIDAEAIELLAEHAWPGNVRELENVIQRAIILAEGDTITAECLPGFVPQIDRESMLGSAAPQTGNFESLLQEYKVRLAMRAIQDCNGNKTLAARSLSISRAYLHRLIRETPEAYDVA